MSTEQTHIPGTAVCDGQPIMSLALINNSNVAAITVCGEVDLSTAPLLTDLVERVVAEHPDRVVIDLANVTFFGAAGLNALLQAYEIVSATGAQLLLRAPSRPTKRILTITETDSILPVETHGCVN